MLLTEEIAGNTTESSIVGVGEAIFVSLNSLANSSEESDPYESPRPCTRTVPWDSRALAWTGLVGSVLLISPCSDVGMEGNLCSLGLVITEDVEWPFLLWPYIIVLPSEPDELEFETWDGCLPFAWTAGGAEAFDIVATCLTVPKSHASPAGSSKSSLFSCVSPIPFNYEESLTIQTVVYYHQHLQTCLRFRLAISHAFQLTR